MSLTRIGLALLLGSSLLLSGCTTWHNPATGETRGSPPSYPECQKLEKVQELDRYCWRTCMDRTFALRGVRNSAACEQECTNQEGRAVMMENENCNAQKARQEGWITK
jgi:hypothetical protein